MAKKGTGKFVLGALIGAGLGLLFAPKSGKETRKALVNKADELIQKVKELEPGEVRDALEDKVKSIMNDIKSLDKEKVISVAKEKASALQEEVEKLVEYAKDKATPVVEEATVALKAKATEVIKKTLEKLED